MPEINLNYPILIEIGGSSGSGFIFHHPLTHRLYLATAEHVLFNQRSGELLGPTMTLHIPTGVRDTPKKIVADVNKLIFRKKNSVDIVVVEIAETGDADNTADNETYHIKFVDGISKHKNTKNVTFTHVPFDSFIKFEDVRIGNDVFVLGYPSSLAGEQIEYDRPLLRKGIIAGINVPKKTIVIDCPVYFGNSGGLALQVSGAPGNFKYNAIGVVSQYVPFVDELTSRRLGFVNTSVENSGYGIVVPTDTIFDLTNEEPEEGIEVQASIK